MTSPRLFSTGTVAVTAGGKRVTLTGALVAEINFTDGDDLQVLSNGSRLAIDALLPDTNQFDLLHEFDGTTDAAAEYTIYRNPAGWGSQRKLSADLSAAVQAKVDQLPVTLEQLEAADAAADVAIAQAGIATTKAAQTAADRGLAQTAAATAQAIADNLDPVAFANRGVYSAWTGLVAVTGAVNTAAEVLPADQGTHTDPVVGGTVANAGVYLWSVSPAGWKWMYPSSLLAPASAPEVRLGTSTSRAVTPAAMADITAAIDSREGFSLVHVGTSPLVDLGEAVAGTLFEDDQGNAPMVVLDDGRIVLAKSRLGDTEVRGALDFEGTQQLAHEEASYEFCITDDDDNVVFGVDLDGNVVIHGFADEATVLASADAANKARSEQLQRRPVIGLQQPTKDVNSIVIYGQSLAVGQETWPPLSKTQKFSNLMLGGAVTPNGTNTSYNQFATAGLQPLIAKGVSGSTILTDPAIAALTPGDGASAENVGIGMANSAALHLARRLLADPKSFLVYCPAVGGKTIEQLSKVNSQDGVNLYLRFTSAVTQAHAAAVAASMSHSVTAIVFMQGEWDYVTTYGSTKATKALYRAMLEQLRTDMIADIKAATGQTEDPVFIIYQTGGSYTADADGTGTAGLHIGMAQLEFALANPKKVALASPAYPVTDKGGHLDANGSRWFGMFLAKAYRRLVIEGTEFRPLSPTKIEMPDALTIRIHFHVPEPPLAFANVYAVNTATDYAAKGFRVTDSGGAKVIASVSIVADTIVEIVLQSALDEATGRIWYAGKTTHNGNGNLRDSDTEVASENYEYLAGTGMYASADIAALNGKPYPLNNWCTAFYLPATYSET
jgi:hypothetical protein